MTSLSTRVSKYELKTDFKLTYPAVYINSNLRNHLVICYVGRSTWFVVQNFVTTSNCWIASVLTFHTDRFSFASRRLPRFHYFLYHLTYISFVSNSRSNSCEKRWTHFCFLFLFFFLNFIWGIGIVRNCARRNNKYLYRWRIIRNWFIPILSSFVKCYCQVK